MRVCSWNQWTKVGTEDGFYCQELRGHNEISMTDYSNCQDGNPCPKTHYQVQSETSMQRCAGMYAISLSLKEKYHYIFSCGKELRKLVRKNLIKSYFLITFLFFSFFFFTEMDCKLPNDVRFIIRVKSLRYRSAAFSVTSGFKLPILCIILLFFLYE